MNGLESIIKKEINNLLWMNLRGDTILEQAETMACGIVKMIVEHNRRPS